MNDDEKPDPDMERVENAMNWYGGQFRLWMEEKGFTTRLHARKAWKLEKLSTPVVIALWRIYWNYHAYDHRPNTISDAARDVTNEYMPDDLADMEFFIILPSEKTDG